MAQGFTVATLLVLQRYMPMLETIINTAPPTTPAKMATRWFFDDVVSGCRPEPEVERVGGEAELYLSGEPFCTGCGFSEADGEGEGEAELCLAGETRFCTDGRFPEADGEDEGGSGCGEEAGPG